jgi:hypothetical protein
LEVEQLGRSWTAGQKLDCWLEAGLLGRSWTFSVVFRRFVLLCRFPPFCVALPFSAVLRCFAVLPFSAVFRRFMLLCRFLPFSTVLRCFAVFCRF